MARKTSTKTPKTRRKATTKASGDEPVVDPNAEAKTEADVTAETTIAEPGGDQAHGTNEDAPAVVQGDEPEVKAPEAEAPRVAEPEAPKVAEPEAPKVSAPEATAPDDAKGESAKGEPEGDDRIITRVYKGVTHTVTRVEGGFEYDGKRYKSLTAIGQVITGQKHMSGPRFFGLAESAGSGRGRLGAEAKAFRDADRARKAAEKAAKVREAEVAAYDVLIDAIEVAVKGGRLTTEQVKRLKSLA